ncbi:MAG TPA: dihydrodipicolinate synthase family protein [Devosiaceae bacterium]
MTRPFLEGIVPILVTPFDRQGRIDDDSLQGLVEFNLKAGVHGLGIAIGSEIHKLSAPERDHVLDIVVKAVNGRVPVVMNVSAAGTDMAVQQAMKAKELGADALMAFPPSFLPTGAEAVVDYFTRIGSGAKLPMVLQDVPQGPISPDMALRLADRIRDICAIKVETLPTVTQVQAMVLRVDQSMLVIGGAGGSYMIEEFRRGARGTMPFCSQPEDFLAVWSALLSGDEAAARDLFDRRIMAVNRLAAQGGDLFYHLHKAILVKRGVIATPFVRGPTASPDSIARAEIEALVDQYFG